MEPKEMMVQMESRSKCPRTDPPKLMEMMVQMEEWR
jgi:hypothetical protein